MKKSVYYITPFIIVPILSMLLAFLDNRALIKESTHILCVLLLFTSIIIGNITPTRKNFDYIMTVIMPLSFFCLMFIVGFLDKCDLETRFHFDRAFKAISQPLSVKMYFMMGIITFLASFKPIRVVRIIKSRNMDA